MKVYVLYFFLFMIFCSCPKLKAQQKYHKDSLQVLLIKNKQLIPILDSVITHEMRCKYYKPNLMFDIGLHLLDSLTLQIESMGFGMTKLSIADLGCFEYRGHFFLVWGKYLDKSIFSMTNRKKEVTCYDWNPSESWLFRYIIDEEGKKESVEFLSVWIYKYDGVKNNFIFREFHTNKNCP